MKRIILSLLQSFLLFFTSVSAEENSPVIKDEIKLNWQFRQVGTAIWHKATVPGCVHTDLLADSLIKDPFYRTNEKDLQWIDKVDWEYETVFNLDGEFLGHEKIELEFMGLDTYTDIFLNGEKLLRTDNMFREWKVECKKQLKQGENRLRILLHSPVKTDIPKLEKLGYQLPAINDQSETGQLDDQKISIFARKAPYHYGWDWGPRFVTSGIWRPIYIKAWNNAKIENIQIIQSSLTKDLASLRANIEINSAVEDSFLLRVVNKNENSLLAEKEIKLSKGENTISAFFEIKDPKFWWPNGLGEQYLYAIETSIIGPKELIDKKSENIGLRTVKLVREKDHSGTSFYFKVNGQPVFMKGANYIPSDIFLNRVSPAEYEKLIQSAALSNMNMLRVWGGGIYENDIFYDLCDRYGILIWQDFMFACSMYPGDEAFLESVKQEAIDNVKRLRNHASIALWCGNNEIEDAWAGWGWKPRYSLEKQKYIYNTYKEIFLNILPTVCKDYDGTRYYWPSSPSSDYGRASKAGSGDTHYWGVWHGKEPFENFQKKLGRFISEYGFQSFPEFKTVKSYTLPEDWDIESEVMAAHQRSGIGNLRIRDYMKMYYKTPKDFQSFLYTGQVMQGYGIKQAIEAHRRNMPYCMGTLFWQLDDCWPVASWSSMDYYKRWKAMQYVAKKAYQTFLISPSESGDNVNFYIISDKPQDTEAQLTVQVIGFSGKELFVRKTPVTVRSNASLSYLSLNKKELLGQSKPDSILISTQLNDTNGEMLSENIMYLRQPKDLSLEKPEIKIHIEKSTNGYSIELSTNKLAKDVYLSLEEEGFFTDNYFDLIPGKAKKLELIGANEIGDIEKKIKIISLIDSYLQ